MQPVPVRLAQTIRLAFRTSRPPSSHGKLLLRLVAPKRALPQPCFQGRLRLQARFYNDKRGTREDEKVSKKQEEILQSSKDEAVSKPSSDLNRGRSPEPPLTDPNLDTASPPDSTSSTNRFSRLPSHIESRRTELSRRFSHLMENVQSNIFVASQRLNDLTGYSGIEALKKEIENQEENVQSTRRAVKEARTAYSSAVATRSTTQREVNDLLQRKHNWSPTDLERFTSLYRSDHANEQAEQAAQDQLSRSEREAEEVSSRLARTILARYHEEQIWSDKIRQMSTWGTWGLMGLNVLLFIVFQIAIEPWRRRRLVRGFEEKVKEAIEREGWINAERMKELAGGGKKGDVGETLAPAPAPVAAPTMAATQHENVEEAIEAVLQNEVAQEFVEEVAKIEPTPIEELPTGQSTFADPASSFAYYEEAFRELFSEKKVLTVTQKELTTVALEGAAGGAALMGLLLVLLRPR